MTRTKRARGQVALHHGHGLCQGLRGDFDVRIEDGLWLLAPGTSRAASTS